MLTSSAGCCACFVPYCLFGKTSSRLKGDQKDSSCNFDIKYHQIPFVKLRTILIIHVQCYVFSLLSYYVLQWVPLMLKRRSIRKHFHIKGSGYRDCMALLCCPCCVLVQQEKQSKFRIEPAQTYNPVRNMEFSKQHKR